MGEMDGQTIQVLNASMIHDAENGYIGKVEFKLAEGKTAYEVALFSKKGKEWMYSLNFTAESGTEEEIVAIEQQLEEDDDLFDFLVDTALSRMEQDPSGGVEGE
ncbi:hypothetical protein [Paenibacillus sp. UNC499MF]|uniref:hypothetical protein n=1 Tax=Paenibacillus sp. UNC499MF TaxID=1502751 RepID=UPI0008A0517B|nr:hypothetical protein [Paenibacillus sp. UNC499MF]SEG65007.1 hypothetical protein SAMN02799616_04040 [Paenibacillus sp. UNC499MF]